MTDIFITNAIILANYFAIKNDLKMTNIIKLNIKNEDV